jgi:NAD-dependent DNA ligase
MAREYSLQSATRKNDDGQPLVTFPAQHLNNAAKAFEQLAAICTGILCDGELNNREAVFFREWVQRHGCFSNIPWFADLSDRVRRIFGDDFVDDDERTELRMIMEHVKGGNQLEANYSNPLPLDCPAPNPIDFEGRFFCITGKFAYGKRSKVMEVISARGGKPTDSQPAQYTNYLLIGKFCSRDWKEQSYGTKIMHALELRDKGFPIKIVSEDHWRGFIA